MPRLPCWQISTVDRANASSACTCPANTYNEDPGAGFSVNCTDCPANSHSSAGATLREYCWCDEGYKHNVSWPEREGVDDADFCLPCNPGYYNAEKNKTLCTACPAGKAGNETASTELADCEACPANFFAEEGQEQCTACREFKVSLPESTAKTRASAGWVRGGDGEHCEACEADFYKPNISDTEQCLQCPDHSSTNLSVAQTSILDCKCNAGYEGDLRTPDDTCTACPQGSYKVEHWSIASCVACPENTTTRDGVIGTLPTDCKCRIQFGIQKDADNNAMKHANGIHICHACGDGEKQTDIANNECGECPAGTNNDANPNICICNPGHEGQADDTSCEKCERGFYKSEPGIGNCTACPGQNLTTELTGTILRDNCTCRWLWLFRRRSRRRQRRVFTLRTRKVQGRLARGVHDLPGGYLDDVPRKPADFRLRVCPATRAMTTRPRHVRRAPLACLKSGLATRRVRRAIPRRRRRCMTRRHTRRLRVPGRV